MKSLINTFEDSIEDSFSQFKSSIWICLKNRRENDNHFDIDKYIDESRFNIQKAANIFIRPSLFNFFINKESVLFDVYCKLFQTGVYGLLYKNNQSFSNILKSLKQLMINKRKDYGTGNILAFGHVGVLLRMSDKIERLSNLVKSSKIPKNETLIDTYQDLVNYAVIGVMLLRNTFEKELENEHS